jgi:sugar O-acyltransferase (sialic acid O-acetyltransferase NeuD family)
MQDVLIFPYNGNGLEAISCLGDNFNFIGFVDDTPEKQGKSPLGFTVYTRKAFSDFPTALVLAVPGSPTSYAYRQKIINELNLPETRFATVVHPKANISAFAIIGTNVLIMAGVVLTSNCVVGSHVCILPNTVIHHDSKIGDYTLIGSNVTVAGNTLIEKNCYIGSGTSIIKSIANNAKVVGNPARLLS